jgi:hypothetical protein
MSEVASSFKKISPTTPQRDLEFENIPQVLRDRNQWVVWHLGQDATGKPTKLPLVRRSDSHLTGLEWPKYPERWSTFDGARAILSQRPSLAGIGMALRYDVNPPGQILVAFDVDDHSPDHRLQLVRDGRIFNPTACDLVERLNSYCEITPSGHGFRVLCLVHSLPTGISPGVTDDVRYHNLGLEIFVGNKFITVTGKHAVSTPTDIPLQSLDRVAASLTFNSRTANGEGTRPRRIESGRHNFLKRQAKKLVSGCWILDTELLVTCLMHLRDTWCEDPEGVPDREVESIADWALIKCSPDPLWQGNDSYLASNLFDSDPKYAAAWRGDFAQFGGNPKSADDYVVERLLKSCSNDAEQALRIYQSSPLYRIVEAQLPDHIRNAGSNQ